MGEGKGRGKKRVGLRCVVSSEWVRRGEVR